MATQNSIDTNMPIEVSDGGTSSATLTDGGVLVGSGSSPITPLSVGATGTLLVGAVGSDAAFATSADSNFTFTSSVAAATRLLTVENTDNTSTSSAALIRISSGGASAGDPTLDFDINSIGDKYIYIDNSDSDKLEIGSSLIEGHINFYTTGEVIKPQTPAFLAQKADGQHATAVTGDGTIYSYICGTEIFDQNSDYNTGTGQFTAPISGRYMLIAGVRLSGVSASGADEFATYINTSNRTYTSGDNRGVAAGGDYETQCVAIADMDQGDVAYPQVSASGGTKTVNVFGFTDPVLTFFAGFLVC